MCDHISGNRGSDKVNHKINHHTEYDVASAYSLHLGPMMFQTYRPSFNSSQMHISFPHFGAFINIILLAWKALHLLMAWKHTSCPSASA